VVDPGGFILVALKYKPVSVVEKEKELFCLEAWEK